MEKYILVNQNTERTHIRIFKNGVGMSNLGPSGAVYENEHEFLACLDGSDYDGPNGSLPDYFDLEIKGNVVFEVSQNDGANQVLPFIVKDADIATFLNSTTGNLPPGHWLEVTKIADNIYRFRNTDEFRAQLVIYGVQVNTVLDPKTLMTDDAEHDHARSFEFFAPVSGAALNFGPILVTKETDDGLPRVGLLKFTVDQPIDVVEPEGVITQYTSKEAFKAKLDALGTVVTEYPNGDWLLTNNNVELPVSYILRLVDSTSIADGSNVGPMGDCGIMRNNNGLWNISLGPYGTDLDPEDGINKAEGFTTNGAFGLSINGEVYNEVFHNQSEFVNYINTYSEELLLSASLSGDPELVTLTNNDPDNSCIIRLFSLGGSESSLVVFPDTSPWWEVTPYEYSVHLDVFSTPTPMLNRSGAFTLTGTDFAVKENSDAIVATQTTSVAELKEAIENLGLKYTSIPIWEPPLPELEMRSTTGSLNLTMNGPATVKVGGDVITPAIEGVVYYYDADDLEDGTLITITGEEASKPLPAVNIERGVKEVVSWSSTGHEEWIRGEHNVTQLTLGRGIEKVPTTAPPKVTNFNGLFRRGLDFNDPSIIDWDVTEVETADETFARCELFNQPLNWKLNKCLSTDNFFASCEELDSDLSGLRIPLSMNIRGFFLDCAKFNHPINGIFDFSTVRYMTDFLLGASAFNQYIDQQDFSNVENASSAFEQAVAYDQPMPYAKFGNCSNFSYMFKGTNYCDRHNISSWCTSATTVPPVDFQQDVKKPQNLPVWGTCPVPGATLEITEVHAVLTVGALVSPTLEITPERIPQRVIWVSSNPDSVDVDEDGKIHAKTIGGATLTCYADELVSTIRISVTV